MSCWFNGNLAEAVQKARGENLPFFAYVYDISVPEHVSTLSFVETEAAELLQKVVAVKILKDSQEFTFFAQLFPIKSLPCLYATFGGVSYGILDEFYLDGNLISSETLKEKINVLIKACFNQNAGSNPNQSSSSNSVKQISKVALDPSVEAYRKKLKEEKELKQKEREEIKRAIEMDKLNRKKEFATNSQEIRPASPATNTPLSSRNEVFLAIRLLDGTVVRHKFRPDNRLYDVRKYIEGLMENSRQAYSLTSVYPIQVLDGAEEKTLKDLGFVPNGTIVLKQVESAEAYAHESTSVISKPFIFLWSILYGIISFIYFRLFKKEKEEDGLTGPSSGSNTDLESNSRIRTIKKDDDDDRNVTYNGNSTNQE